MRRQKPSRICSRHGLALSASSGGMAESREKREERREQMAASSIHCIFTMSRDHLEKVLNIRNGQPKIFTAYLRRPVTTSKSAPKVLEPSFAKSLTSRGGFQRLAKSIHCIFTVSRGHVHEGRKVPKK